MDNVIDSLPETFKKDIINAIEILKKYGCSEIYIFGSLVTGRYKESSDIDIAVKGLPVGLLIKAYSDLSFNLKHNIDLVNIDTKKEFAGLLSDIKELHRVA